MCKVFSIWIIIFSSLTQFCQYEMNEFCVYVYIYHWFWMDIEVID